jgi:hypothetical protein
MEWVIMWAVIFAALNFVSTAIGLAYLHANNNHLSDGIGWVALGLMFTGFDVVIIGGGYIYYMTYILPVVHGR